MSTITNSEEIEGTRGRELLDVSDGRQTVEGLDAEILELAELTRVAKEVRDSGTDRKWTRARQEFQDRNTHDCQRLAAQAHHLHRAP